MLQKDLGQVSGSPRRSEHKPCPSDELKNIFVPLESIKSSMCHDLGSGMWTSRALCVHVWLPSSSGHLEPVTLLDRGGIRVSLHFTFCPRSHPDVAVLVVSTVNTSALPVKDYLFQAAVPKVAPLQFKPLDPWTSACWRELMCDVVPSPADHVCQTPACFRDTVNRLQPSAASSGHLSGSPTG